MIILELTTEQADLVKKVNDYHEKISIILKSGLLDYKSTSVVINFDHNGEIATINKVNELVYTAKYGIVS